MKEANIQTLLGKYFTENKPPYSFSYELKLINLSKTKSFSFSRLPQHQIDGLVASLEGQHIKISDSPIYNGMKTRFTHPKTYDAMWFIARRAFVILCWYVPRQKKTCYLIEVESYKKMVAEHPRKSIRMDEIEPRYIFGIIDL